MVSININSDLPPPKKLDSFSGGQVRTIEREVVLTKGFDQPSPDQFLEGRSSICLRNGISFRKRFIIKARMVIAKPSKKTSAKAEFRA